MSKEQESDNSGCAIGCVSIPTVLTIGLALSIFGAAIGGGCSVRIPFTESNVSIAGSVGEKNASRRALPNYLSEKLGSNYNFINSSNSLVIGPAEGNAILVVGKQPGAPAVDLNISLTR